MKNYSVKLSAGRFPQILCGEEHLALTTSMADGSALINELNTLQEQRDLLFAQLKLANEAMQRVAETLNKQNASIAGGTEALLSQRRLFGHIAAALERGDIVHASLLAKDAS